MKAIKDVLVAEVDVSKHKKFSFDRDLRLLTAESYQKVFSNAQRFGNKSFTLLARLNDLDHARLGLAISKKSSKKAVDRNRIKRKFRESFRTHQMRLPNVDIIAMSKPNANLLDNEEIRKQIDLQWHFIQKKFSKLAD